MNLKFYNIVKPLDTIYSSDSTDTWGDKIITIECQGVYLKAESLLENIIEIEPENPTKKNPLEYARGTSNVRLTSGSTFYLAHYKNYYKYTLNTDGSITLTKVDKTFQDWEKQAGLYRYNLMYLQQFIYNYEGIIGKQKVGQNYWLIQKTNNLEDDEYIYYDRTYETLNSDWDIKALYEQGEYDKINEAIENDTTLLNAYSALKKAVALAEFYCTCLPMRDTRVGSTEDDFNFFTFYTRKLSDSAAITTLEDSYVQFKLDDYTKNYTIDPQTHVLKLGTAELSSLIFDDNNPLPYFKIRDYYRNAALICVARPDRIEGEEDYPTDTHFQQILQKTNVTFDFSIPTDIWETEVGVSTRKYYVYDKILGEWKEVDSTDINIYKEE